MGAITLSPRCNRDDSNSVNDKKCISLRYMMMKPIMAGKRGREGGRMLAELSCVIRTEKTCRTIKSLSVHGTNLKGKMRMKAKK